MVHYRGGRASIDEAVYPEMERSGTTSLRRTPSRCGRIADRGARTCSSTTPASPTSTTPASASSSALGSDAEHQHELYIRNINKAIADRPDTLSVTTHMCRGNYRSSWAAEGGYDFVAEALFSELDVDGFFLEYDDDRSGGFEPLRFVPPGKQVVLGLVTTKQRRAGGQGHPEAPHRRGRRHVPLDQLCLSPQCGFSSTVEGNSLTLLRADGQAAAGRRDRCRGVGLSTAARLR